MDPMICRVDIQPEQGSIVSGDVLVNDNGYIEGIIYPKKDNLATFHLIQGKINQGKISLTEYSLLNFKKKTYEVTKTEIGIFEGPTFVSNLDNEFPSGMVTLLFLPLASDPQKQLELNRNIKKFKTGASRSTAFWKSEVLTFANQYLGNQEVKGSTKVLKYPETLEDHRNVA